MFSVNNDVKKEMEQTLELYFKQLISKVKLTWGVACSQLFFGQNSNRTIHLVSVRFSLL